jgi:hypothetical protein
MEKEKKKDCKKPVKISDTIHAEIKILAAIDGITMGEYLEEIYKEHKKVQEKTK